MIPMDGLLPNDEQLNGAVISDDCEHRYELWRTWDAAKPTVLFVMLNPSTADHRQDDPTIRRCLRFARDWGYGRLLVGNLFALRATDPSDLYVHANPVGWENDDALRAMHDAAALTVCAWGVHGAHQRRGELVRAMLEGSRRPSVHHLGLTMGGHPRHPLYLRADTLPTLW